MKAQLEELEKQLAEFKVQECLVYSRVVGYYQNTGGWNPGKKEEWKERKKYDISFLKEEQK